MLLVDKNLWYRQVKLVYGREAQRWDAATALETLPPLYGIWHPYKQVLHVLYRRLTPLFVYVQKGSLEPGARPMEKPKLRTLESWIDALLMLPADRRLRLRAIRTWTLRRIDELRAEVTERDAKVLYARTMLDRAEEKVAEMEVRAAAGRPLARIEEERLQGLLLYNREAWRRAEVKRKAASEELRALRRDLPVLDAWLDLLMFWAPACFALGWRVRDCHWEHRRAGTGCYAREALRTSLLLMLHLEGPRNKTEPAHRSLPTAPGPVATGAGGRAALPHDAVPPPTPQGWQMVPGGIL